MVNIIQIWHPCRVSIGNNFPERANVMVPKMLQLSILGTQSLNPGKKPCLCNSCCVGIRCDWSVIWLMAEDNWPVVAGAVTLLLALRPLWPGHSGHSSATDSQAENNHTASDQITHSLLIHPFFPRPCSNQMKITILLASDLLTF